MDSADDNASDNEEVTKIKTYDSADGEEVMKITTWKGDQDVLVGSARQDEVCHAAPSSQSCILN